MDFRHRDSVEEELSHDMGAIGIRELVLGEVGVLRHVQKAHILL